MALVIKHNTREYKPVSAGTHLAICTMVVDLGVQDDSKFGPRERVHFCWEICDETVTWRDRNGIELSGPARISREFTMSLGPKSALRPFLEGWRGKPFTDTELKSFNIRTFLGKACYLGVVHRDSGGRTYHNVATATAPPKDVNPEPVGEVIIFDLADWDEVSFQKLPQKLQQRIRDRIVTEPPQKITQPESGHSREPSAAVTEPAFEDEIPF